MKKLNLLILLFFVFISGCGGGGGAVNDELAIITEDPEILQVELYEYSVTINGYTQSYNGKCIFLYDVLYCYPTTIANSEYTVSAKIESGNVKLFSYFDRSLIVEFNLGDGSIYALNLTEIGAAESGSIDGIWYNSTHAGSFGDIVLTAIYDDGIINATDTSGCNISGNVNPVGNIYSVNFTLIDCEHSGEYFGALQIADGKISGLVSNESKAIILYFNLD